jgi:hypothetical protein
VGSWEHIRSQKPEDRNQKELAASLMDCIIPHPTFGHPLPLERGYIRTPFSLGEKVPEGRMRGVT